MKNYIWYKEGMNAIEAVKARRQFLKDALARLGELWRENGMLVCDIDNLDKAWKQITKWEKGEQHYPGDIDFHI